MTSFAVCSGAELVAHEISQKIGFLGVNTWPVDYGLPIMIKNCSRSNDRLFFSHNLFIEEMALPLTRADTKNCYS